MGAIVIGDAAVNAGIVGAPMVIIIALTALSSFVIPALTEFMIIYRLLFVILGSFMGLIGIASLLMILLAQLLSIESFGIPYTTIRSANKKIKDFIFRSPLNKMNYRPFLISKNNVKRQGF
jgi:spore germination protein KA